MTNDRPEYILKYVNNYVSGLSLVILYYWRHFLLGFSSWFVYFFTYKWHAADLKAAYWKTETKTSLFNWQKK